MGNEVIYNVPAGTYQRDFTKERSLIFPLNSGDYQLTVTDICGDGMFNGIYDFGVFNGNVIVYLGDAGKPFFDFDGYEYTLDFVVP